MMEEKSEHQRFTELIGYSLALREDQREAMKDLFPDMEKETRTEILNALEEEAMIREKAKNEWLNEALSLHEKNNTDARP